MNNQVVKYEKLDAVSIIRMDRPEAMNSLNAQLRCELRAAIETAGSDASVRAIVLTGTGRCFCAGADLKTKTTDLDVEQTLQTEYRPIFEAIAEMRQPVICAINGSAAGIGLSLALACDLLIMAQDAFMLSPFTNISLVPDGGLSWYLVHQLGYRRAFQLSIESERISAERCVQLGLANRTVSAETLMEETLKWAIRLAERAPLSMAATKKTMRFSATNDWAHTFDIEASEQKTLRASADHAAGVAAFLEKRNTKFEGR